MESSMATTPYRYKPLPQDRQLSFRIFTLYPAHKISAPIRGKLHISSPSNSDLECCKLESYEALSYAWGDAIFTEVIEFPDKSYLPIATNLDSFLRYRRQGDAVILLWVDAICINQQDHEEKSSQVQAMGQIYSLASCLSVWLGSPSDDSTLGMSALQEISHEHAFSKLSMSSEQSVAIERLLNRAWWFRAWIIQEVALGGLGPKYKKITVRCGFDGILWFRLVLACSRIYVNTLEMRQSFPDVGRVLSLDTLPSRGKDEVLGAGESYPYRLLRQMSEHRNCLASDPRDKIYAMLGLWFDAISVGKQNGMSRRTAPTVKYDRCVEDVYVEFATWIIHGTSSLELLHHCQPHFLDCPTIELLPTWVPDWSQALTQARLPSAQVTDRGSIPWWSLPVRSGVDNRRIQYRMQDQKFRRERAKEILRPLKSTLHFIPEWIVDVMDPDGTKGYESLFQELKVRTDVLFVLPDESDRELGNEEEDVWNASRRTQIHNERHLQAQVLSQYVEDYSRLWTRYRACADTTCKVAIMGRRMNVEGILVDTIRNVFDPFPEDIEKDWTNSTLLMVQIGKCKQTVMGQDIDKAPYLTETTRLMAFWRTLFAGQQASDETKIASWLPLTPHNWQWSVPSLTILESARLEFAEIRAIIQAFAEHVASIVSDEGTLAHDGFDEHLANDDIMLDARWSSSDRLEYANTFETLGKEWLKQPYDLYHRPFTLPYVVPDPFWESRCLHDETALEASIRSRHRTIIESLNAETRELRRDARRFVSDKIRQRPAREPPSTDNPRLIKDTVHTATIWLNISGRWGIIYSWTNGW
ncbi:HET-domain-containing protein [Paraphaeosphaeria sporulosa]|uniref:HET-domain-containing protein n=1 Tax=Paraphaeosphaeria sporulosa TaxID=1460663 RepID=A0A177CM04_9PLEO|nr:HET-domain-containing protein [Paraphaeosphaeria sporulosa]OAG07888.1 HET-domain-containing protein [Paraphaeosphaeria sporulosa]